MTYHIRVFFPSLTWLKWYSIWTLGPTVNSPHFLFFLPFSSPLQLSNVLVFYHFDYFFSFTVVWQFLFLIVKVMLLIIIHSYDNEILYKNYTLYCKYIIDIMYTPILFKIMISNDRGWEHFIFNNSFLIINSIFVQ